MRRKVVTAYQESFTHTPICGTPVLPSAGFRVVCRRDRTTGRACRYVEDLVERWCSQFEYFVRIPVMQRLYMSAIAVPQLIGPCEMTALPDPLLKVPRCWDSLYIESQQI